MTYSPVVILLIVVIVLSLTVLIVRVMTYKRRKVMIDMVYASKPGCVVNGVNECDQKQIPDITDENSCGSECEKTSKCVAWTYNRTSHRCDLKNDLSKYDLKPGVGYTSGTMF